MSDTNRQSFSDSDFLRVEHQHASKGVQKVRTSSPCLTGASLFALYPSLHGITSRRACLDTGQSTLKFAHYPKSLCPTATRKVPSYDIECRVFCGCANLEVRVNHSESRTYCIGSTRATPHHAARGDMSDDCSTAASHTHSCDAVERRPPIVNNGLSAAKSHHDSTASSSREEPTFLLQRRANRQSSFLRAASRLP